MTSHSGSYEKSLILNCDDGLELGFIPSSNVEIVRKFDSWLLGLVLSSMLSSYFSKLSVRINMQVVGFVVPNHLSVILAYVLQWLFFPDELNANVDESVYIGILVFAIIPFVLLFTHLWTSDYMIYPLERDVFVLPSYRAIFTPTASLLNRTIVELPNEWMNIKLRDAESTNNTVAEAISSLGRKIFGRRSSSSPAELWSVKRKRNSYDKSARWLNGPRLHILAFGG